MGVVSKKLRDSARDKECTLRTIYCIGGTATTVLAHLPSPIKGMGNKGDDFHAVYACHRCHLMLDERRLGPHEGRYMLDALQRTQRIWFDEGLLKVPVTEKRPVVSSKIMRRA